LGLRWVGSEGYQVLTTLKVESFFEHEWVFWVYNKLASVEVTFFDHRIEDFEDIK
jgi:hypothetical protein